MLSGMIELTRYQTCGIHFTGGCCAV